MRMDRPDDSEPIDQITNWSIREAVAQRLRENLSMEPSRLSARLSILMDELRRRDRGDGFTSN